MPTKMGRPKVDNPKDVRYSIRLDADTEQRLEAYCVRRNVTKGAAIREALELLLLRDEKVSAVTFEPRQRLLPKTPYPPRMMA